MAKAYFGSKLSEHIIKTPEGFLICKDVPIARTGWQNYIGKEIGLSDENYDKIVKVYRSEKEVFSSRVYASFEGKAFTDEHPSDWVTPYNVNTYLKGTAVNIRRGEGKSSDLLLADLIVYNPQQIENIENKVKREISCGYECEYVPYEGGYEQINIVGNHIALVTAGRAGSRVAIKDSKNLNNERRKNNMRLPRSGKASDFMKAVGLKAFAQDAEPEDIVEAVDEMVNEKRQAEIDAEPIIIEKESEPKVDEDLEDVKKKISEVKDAIMSMLTNDEESKKEEEEDDTLDSLEELENEEVEDDEIDEIESIEKPAKEINAEDDEIKMGEEAYTVDSIKELISVLKPIVASIPDKKIRKKTSDDLAKVMKKHIKQSKDAKQSSSNNYSDFMNRTHDNSAVESEDKGMEIAKKFNPHYKEK